jgi:hypothetical protein
MKATASFWAVGIFVLAGLPVSAQKSSRVILTVYEDSSGPLGGQKGTSCLTLYADGRVLLSSWSTAAVALQDESGKVSRPEKKETREYRFPDDASWQISDFSEFLESKQVRRLKPYFAPPHNPIDFFELSKMKVFSENGAQKEIQTRGYYVASLTEKARYPSALILLMNKIEEFENTVAEKGTVTETLADCGSVTAETIK